MLGRVSRVLGVVVTGLLVVSCSPAPQPVPESRVRRDIVYVPGGSAAQKLDLYYPTGASSAHPLAIFIHGGRWAEGDKSLINDDGLKANLLRDRLLARGYAIASINYRLSGEATFPAPIHDVKAAVRHLRANALSLGVDPDRFAVIGESAGAHLAQLVATSGGVPELEGDLGATGVSSRVQAVVSFYGISDSRTRASQRQDQGCGQTGRTTTSDGAMLGAELDTERGAQLAAQAAPLTYVDRTDPPMLLLHGRQDCNVPFAQSQTMHAALKAAGVATELALIDAPHANPAFYTTPALQDQVLRFLDTVLVTPRPTVSREALIAR